MRVADIKNEKIKILMIDDDEIFCQIYKTLLDDTNKYFVTAVTSGRDGLNLAKNQKYDVILIDIMMPTLDGADVARLLSCNKATKDIPCIFITSLIKPHENKANDKHLYLGKPINLEELASTIDEVLAHRHINSVSLE